MRPDIAIFQHHVQDAAFQIGMDNGMWGLIDENLKEVWPSVILWVQAVKKESRPSRYYFKFDLSGYPTAAPTACPWNPDTGTRLESSLWPRGAKFVNNTFNYGWNPCALYAPCDRIAMAGHDAWREQFPDLWWQSSFKITVYLNFLHRLLNSSDYANS